MIIDRSGRSCSTRTKEEVDFLLQKELAALNAEERAALQAILGQFSTEEAVELLAKSEYKHAPVDMQTFVKDPYYLGNTCDNIYPKLLDDLTELFDGTHNEAILTGAIGWGKSHFASIGVCRILYELSCMRSPHTSFGLSPGSNISLVMLSVSEQLAVKVVFESIATKVRASPYFQENFPFEVTKKELRFPGNVWVAARASTDTSVLGLNVFGAVLDETNFMHQKKVKISSSHSFKYDRAETLYNALQRRMKSRFERYGRLPGILFVVSSKKTTEDFTSRRVKESKADPAIFVRDYALWDVRPEDYYKAKRFWVLCGNEKTPSRIIPESEDVEAIRKSVPEDVVLIDVPEDFRLDFERDLEGSIRDIAGVSTVAVSPFITRREKIEEAVDHGRAHPFTVDVLDPSQGGTFRWELLSETTDARLRDGSFERVVRPKLDPRAPRHIHIDPSLSGDATGFVMGHVSKYVEVRRQGAGGEVYSERAPVFVVDVALRIVPPAGDEIILSDVRKLIYELTAHGFNISMVTLDRFQSADMIQKLAQKGYNAEILSVDLKMDPYEILKQSLYEGRVRLYDYKPLLDELRTLERDMTKGKVDHPPNGSKDIADALAGVCYSLSQKTFSEPLPILPTSAFPQGETWLPEQRQAALAGQRGADVNRSIAPPFLGGGLFDDWESGFFK